MLRQPEEYYLRHGPTALLIASSLVATAGRRFSSKLLPLIFFSPGGSGTEQVTSQHYCNVSERDEYSLCICTPVDNKAADNKGIPP
jgi:hypothetical protein